MPLIGATAICELSAGEMPPRDLLAALEPELRSEVVGRGVELQEGNNTVILRIKSQDIPDLRAALNSYLHWFHSMGEVGRIFGKK
jgi:tRNA threonylcarbamoyladenosine modification (KEOPS) complex  Pcc1 subunit